MPELLICSQPSLIPYAEIPRNAGSTPGRVRVMCLIASSTALPDVCTSWCTHFCSARVGGLDGALGAGPGETPGFYLLGKNLVL